MSRKKTSVPLFELMSKSRAGVGEAHKAEGPAPSPKPVPAGTRATARPPLTHRPEVKQKDAAATPAASPDQTQKLAQAYAPPAEPMLQTGDGRLRVSLNYVSSVVVLAGLLLLLIASFVLGRKTAPQQVVTAAGEPVVREVMARLPGRYYLAMATTAGAGEESRQQALAAQQYLQSRGLWADVGIDNPSHPERYIVWSLMPYDSGSSAEATAYASRVRRELAQFPGAGSLTVLPAGPEGRSPWFAPYNLPSNN